MDGNQSVGIVVKEFPPDTIGGAETQTKRMATALAERGRDVTVFTKRYGPHDDSELPFEVVRVRTVDWSPMVSDLVFLLACAVAIVRRRSEIDCLQCMMVYPIGFLGYLVHKLTSLPYFAWIRGNDFYVGKEVRWKRWMIRRVLDDALVLVQSPEIREDVREEFPGVDAEIAVLGNGVTIPAERADPDAETVLYLGRLAPKKGVEYLLRGLDGRNAKLRIVGDGSERERLERLAETLDVDVAFEGFVPPDKVGEYYRSAGVFVLPSTEGEGMPNAVLEAMAHGVPVVTTESGGLPSVVEDGSNGYVVPMRDPAALGDAIERLLRAPDERRRMGAAAREYVRENHSWERIVDDLEDMYDQVSVRRE